MKKAVQTTAKKAETMARTRRDVDVDGRENVGAGGIVDDSVGDDSARRADDGAGDGVARRCGRR